MIREREKGCNISKHIYSRPPNFVLGKYGIGPSHKESVLLLAHHKRWGGGGRGMDYQPNHLSRLGK